MCRCEGELCVHVCKSVHVCTNAFSECVCICVLGMSVRGLGWIVLRTVGASVCVCVCVCVCMCVCMCMCIVLYMYIGVRGNCVSFNAGLSYILDPI